MKTLFTEVSLDKVEFTNNSFDISIYITNSANEEYCIYCKHVNAFKLQNSFELSDKEIFPTFISDIFYEELELGQAENKFRSLGYAFTEGFPYNPNNNLVMPQNESYNYLCLEGAFKVELICVQIKIEK